jgi:mannitol-specific phosphotransferase system IIBC component
VEPAPCDVISQIKQNSSDMNEIILAPCDVISKIKQNSSDMNEIILAPCDAGYVQSCTGYIMLRDQLLSKRDF